MQLIPTPKKDHRFPVILSPQEVLQALQAAPSFSHHVIFSTLYGTGMRVSEAVHLLPANIDSQRMMIRIELSGRRSLRERPGRQELAFSPRRKGVFPRKFLNLCG
jgi:site-specific recombinase XerD